MSSSASVPTAPVNRDARPIGQWRIIMLLMMLVGLGHFNRIGISVAGTEQIMRQYGILPKEMGLVYSAFLVTYTLAMIPGGWFIDRFGPRSALMVFCAGSAVFVALTGFTGMVFEQVGAVFFSLFAVRTIMGAINAPLHPGSAYMVFRHAPPAQRSLANGLVTFAACIGIASTYYGFGSLMDHVGWPGAFQISSAVTTAAALLWWALTRGAGAPLKVAGAGNTPKKTSSAILAVLRNRSVICITLSYGALGYFQYLFFYWMEYFFKEIEHQSTDTARWYSTLITLAMGVGMICGGWLADRVSFAFWPKVRRGLVPALCMALSGALFVVGLTSSDSRVTLASFIATAALIGASEGAFWTTVVELGGEHGGTSAAIMNTGGNAGGTLSPYLTPVLSAYFTTHFGESLGWRIGLGVAAVATIIGALLWWGVETRDHHLEE